MYPFLVNVVFGRRNPLNLLFTTTINPLLVEKKSYMHLLRPLHHKPIEEVEVKPIPKNLSSSALTVSYLINSCGLSPQSALSASKKFTIKSTEKPDSNLALFKSHGFSDTQITKLISQFPKLLLSKWDKTIKPKFDYFLSVGYSSTDLIALVSLNPDILRVSLQRRLKPNFDLLRPIFSTNQQLITAIHHSVAWLLTINLEANFLPNVRILQGYGVPASHIAKLASSFPRRVILPTERFKTSVESIRKMGFDPLSAMFVHGITAMSGMGPSTWERKVAFYKSMGWSEAEFISAFRKQPMVMLFSDEKIKRVMDFAVQKMNWGPSFVAAYPVLLTYSLEKRTIPRCSVMKLLESNGLTVRSKCVGFLIISETDFLNKYVLKYQDQIPELLQVYKGNLESL